MTVSATEPLDVPCYGGPRAYRIRSRHQLRALRLGAGLTQVQVSTRVGASRAAVTHWELGRNASVDAAYARRLADAFGVDMAALFDLPSEPIDPSP